MVKKLMILVKAHWDVFTYLFFGGLTTLVNFAVYWPLFNLASLSGTASNVIAWAAAVVFAFLTNKPFVFHSHDWHRNVVIPELAKFVGCRIGSGLLETGIIFVTVDLLRWNGNLWKILVSILVVILNYVGSKLLVFKNK